MNYAIVDKKTKEFYPDPIYADKQKAEAKVAYLVDYRIKNKMEYREYVIEELTPERVEQHEREWKKWGTMID